MLKQYFLSIPILQNYLLHLKWLIIAVSVLEGNLDFLDYLQKRLKDLVITWVVLVLDTLLIYFWDVLLV